MKRKFAAVLMFLTLLTPLAFADDSYTPNNPPPKSCEQTLMQQIEGVWADVIAGLFE
jgi:hypothetical protein